MPEETAISEDEKEVVVKAYPPTIVFQNASLVWDSCDNVHIAIELVDNLLDNVWVEVFGDEVDTMETGMPIEGNTKLSELQLLWICERIAKQHDSSPELLLGEVHCNRRNENREQLHGYEKAEIVEALASVLLGNTQMPTTASIKQAASTALEQVNGCHSVFIAAALVNDLVSSATSTVKMITKSQLAVLLDRSRYICDASLVCGILNQYQRLEQLSKHSFCVSMYKALVGQECEQIARKGLKRKQAFAECRSIMAKSKPHLERMKHERQAFFASNLPQTHGHSLDIEVFWLPIFTLHTLDKVLDLKTTQNHLEALLKNCVTVRKLSGEQCAVDAEIFERCLYSKYVSENDLLCLNEDFQLDEHRRLGNIYRGVTPKAIQTLLRVQSNLFGKDERHLSGSTHEVEGNIRGTLGQRSIRIIVEWDVHAKHGFESALLDTVSTMGMKAEVQELGQKAGPHGWGWGPRLLTFSEYWKDEINTKKNTAEDTGESDVLARVFKLIDANGDGALTATELHQGMQKLGVGMHFHDIKVLLQTVDTDNSGSISIDEFREKFAEHTPMLIFAMNAHKTLACPLHVSEAIFTFLLSGSSTPGMSSPLCVVGQDGSGRASAMLKAMQLVQKKNSRYRIIFRRARGGLAGEQLREYVAALCGDICSVYDDVRTYNDFSKLNRREVLFKFLQLLSEVPGPLKPLYLLLPSIDQLEGGREWMKDLLALPSDVRLVISCTSNVPGMFQLATPAISKELAIKMGRHMLQSDERVVTQKQIASVCAGVRTPLQLEIRMMLARKWKNGHDKFFLDISHVHSKHIGVKLLLRAAQRANIDEQKVKELLAFLYEVRYCIPLRQLHLEIGDSIFVVAEAIRPILNLIHTDEGTAIALRDSKQLRHEVKEILLAEERDYATDRLVRTMLKRVSSGNYSQWVLRDCLFHCSRCGRWTEIVKIVCGDNSEYFWEAVFKNCFGQHVVSDATQLQYNWEGSFSSLSQFRTRINFVNLWFNQLSRRPSCSAQLLLRERGLAKSLLRCSHLSVGRVNALALRDAHGNGYVVAGGDFCWITEGLHDHGHPFCGDSVDMQSIECFENGALCFTGGKTGLITLWALPDGQVLDVLKAHSAEVAALSVSPDELSFASVSWDCRLSLWDLGSRVHMGSVTHSTRLSDVAFNKDGSILACCGWDGKLYLYSLNKMMARLSEENLAKTLKVGRDQCTAVCFAPLHNTVVVGNVNGIVSMYDAEKGITLHRLKRHLNSVTGVSFLPHGETFASTSTDGSVVLWDFRSGSISATIEESQDPILSMRINREGTTVTTLAHNCVSTWSLGSTGQLRNHERVGQEATAFSLHTHVYGTGYDDGSVKLFEKETGNEVAILPKVATGSVRDLYVGKSIICCCSVQRVEIISPVSLKSIVSITPVPYMSLLRQSELFRDCSKEFMLKITSNLNAKVFAENAWLAKEGEVASEINLMIAGRANVVVKGVGVVGSVCAGDVFGETSALDGKPRTASIRAVEPSQLASVSMTIFQSLLDEYDEDRRICESILTKRKLGNSIINNFPLFRDCPRQLVDLLVDQSSTASFKAGEVIMKQGDVGKSMYCILEGTLSIEVENVGTVAELTKGQVVGETALISAEPFRTATAITKETSILLVISAETFQTMAQKWPQHRENVVKIATDRNPGIIPAECWLKKISDDEIAKNIDEAFENVVVDPSAPPTYASSLKGVQSCCMCADPLEKVVLIGCDDGGVQAFSRRPRSDYVSRCVEQIRLECRKKKIDPPGPAELAHRADELADSMSLRRWFLFRNSHNHSGRINTIQFASTGTWYVTASEDTTLKISTWKTIMGRRMDKTLSGHSQAVTSVQITENCLRIISGSMDKSARVWDVATGATLFVIDDHFLSVTCVDMTKDAKMAITGCEDRRIRIWELTESTVGKQGKVSLYSSIESHRGIITTVKFCVDKDSLENTVLQAFSTSTDGTCRFWDIHRAAELYNSQALDAACLAHLDQRLICVGGRDSSSLIIWDSETKKPVSEIGNASSAIQCCAVAPIQTPSAIMVKDCPVKWPAVLSGTTAGEVLIWNVHTGRVSYKEESGKNTAITACAWTADAQWIVTGGYDGTVHLWAIRNSFIRRAKQHCMELFKHNASVTAVAFFELEDRIVASSSKDCTIVLVDMESAELKLTFNYHSSPVIALHIAKDSRTALSGTSNGEVLIWSLRTGRIRHKEMCPGRLTALTICINVENLAMGSSDSNIYFNSIFDDSQTRRVAKGHALAVTSVEFNNDSTLTLSASDDETVRIWKTENCHCLQIIQIHSPCLQALWTNDCSMIVWCNAKGEAGVCEFSGSSVSTLINENTNSGSIKLATVSPNKALLATYGTEKVVRLWNIQESRRCVSILGPYFDEIVSLRFSPSSLTITLTDAAKKIQVIDLKTLKMIAWMWPHAHPLVCAFNLALNLQFISDEVVISADTSGEIKITGPLRRRFRHVIEKMGGDELHHETDTNDIEDELDVVGTWRKYTSVSSEITKFLSFIDNDENASIDYSEFLKHFNKIVTSKTTKINQGTDAETLHAAGKIQDAMAAKIKRQYQSMHDAFLAFDEDGNGELSAAEFGRAIHSLDIDLSELQSDDSSMLEEDLVPVREIGQISLKGYGKPTCVEATTIGRFHVLVLLGTDTGRIRMWESRRLLSAATGLLEFVDRGCLDWHSARISNLSMDIGSESYFLSASSDGTACMWRLKQRRYEFYKGRVSSWVNKLQAPPIAELALHNGSLRTPHLHASMTSTGQVLSVAAAFNRRFVFAKCRTNE